MRGRITVKAAEPKKQFLSSRVLSGKMILLAALCFFLCCLRLHAGGGSEETEIDPLYDTWTLTITQFDFSALPLEKQIIGNQMIRSIKDQLSSLKVRIRSPEETAYYAAYALSEARLKAAEALQSKRKERDALLFRGDASWTYNSKIKTIDETIKTLEEEYSIIEAEYPLITEQPQFLLSEKNLSGTYPPVPENGMEYSFCREQKIDAFLTGTVTEYYGRMYVSVKLYMLYNRSYIYEDYVLFSVEDQETALAELSSRLRSVLSGIEGAAVIVRAEPEDAVILINDAYAGRGNTGERDQDPETIIVEVYADDYHKAEFQLDLFSGELADVFIGLQPVEYKPLRIDTIDGFPSSVYLGSTYMGTTPLSLNLLSDQAEYITMENERGDAASFIYSGTASSQIVTLAPETFDGRTVEDYRKKFYGAYGRFWLSLPILVLLYGTATAAKSASDHAIMYMGLQNQDMYDYAMMNRYIAIGTAAIAGGFLIETLIRMGIYLYKSNATNVINNK